MWIVVLIGFRFNLFLIVWLLRLKFKLELLIKMIWGEGVFLSWEFFFNVLNSRDFEVCGVVGKNKFNMKKIIIGIVKLIILNINFFINLF